MRIYELIIESSREDHITRHQVSVAEVEEVVFGTPLVLRARQGRYHLIGQTASGRYLAIFVAPEGTGSMDWLLPGTLTQRSADGTKRSGGADEL